MTTSQGTGPHWEYCRLSLGRNSASTWVFDASSVNIAGQLQSGTSFEQCLDILGKDRWELITIVDDQGGPYPKLAYFKRLV